VSIELAQADLARSALDAGRPEEAVARLVAWIAPLSVFHRTAEGQALDALTRARLARALGTLAEAFGTLRRVEERHEVLRLSLQYALDGEAAPTLYRTLAAAMIEDERFAEAIGPLRRALALGGARREVLPMLGLAFARSGRAVAALACARELRAMGHEDTVLEESLTTLLGGPKADFEHWIDQGELRDRTQSMPPLAMPEG
jgi:tetratricopeptide (TPR) repeat protein